MAFNPNQAVRVEGRPDPAPPRPPAEDQDPVRAEQMKQRLEALVGRLEQTAKEQVSKRATIEDRWLDDLRQYYGRYDTKTESNLKENKKSRVFVNLTRARTHTWEARLSDMLFPSDDKNWGIRPTPVPELQQAVEQQNPGEANVSTIGPVQGQPQAQNPKVEKAKAEIEAVKAASSAMEKEIEDQLKESDYSAQMRRVINNATRIGSGICKGPTTANRTKRQWAKKDPAANVFKLNSVADKRPDNRWVDPWSFFPDMSATTVEEMPFSFERHLYNEKQVKKLAKQPGFDHGALRVVIEEGPQEAYPSYVQELREIAGAGQDSLKDRFHVWEYHGPLERADLEAICECTDNNDMLAEFDPLEEINVIVWFCQGHLLKFAEQPMESGDSIYSIFSFEKDDTSVFGYGIPYLMRDSQSAINGAWRMTMDNAGLSVGPQIVIDANALEPANGFWDLTPLKVWWRKTAPVPNAGKPFEIHNIPNNQEQLTAIIEMAMKFADDETNMPVIAQGEQGAHITKTAMGMAILMNSVNVVFRRVVKNFDDDVTVPNISRMYDWNMQFNPKGNIKGDFDVDARGSSVLLVREMQSQNLMVMASTFTNHPVLGPMTKAAPLYRETVKSHGLPHAEIVMSDSEIKAEQDRKAAQAEQDPELMKLQTQERIAKMEADSRIAVAQMARETKLMELAEKNNMSLADTQAKLGIAQMKLDGAVQTEQTRADSKERIMAAEVAVQERQPATAGGGGGYV